MIVTVLLSLLLCYYDCHCVIMTVLVLLSLLSCYYDYDPGDVAGATREKSSLSVCFFTCTALPGPRRVPAVRASNGQVLR